MDKQPIYIYTHDGLYKVDITAATLLGDVLRDKNIDRQGEMSQLWKSKNGQYFTGSCLQYITSSTCPNRLAQYYFINLIDIDAARAWVVKYYGGDALSKFGFDAAMEV